MSVFKSNFFLLMAAAIWGFAFVAQRVGMDHLGPLPLPASVSSWAAFL